MSLLLVSSGGDTAVKTVLAAAGRRFLQAFAAALVVLIPGILAAPDLNATFALGVAALFASVAAGIKALTEFVPQLSFGAYVRQPIGAWLDAFVQAGLGALVITIPGVLAAPDLATGRTLGLAALIGALTAGFRALEGLLTPGENPAPATGVRA